MTQPVCNCRFGRLSGRSIIILLPFSVNSQRALSVPSLPQSLIVFLLRSEPHNSVSHETIFWNGRTPLVRLHYTHKKPGVFLCSWPHCCKLKMSIQHFHVSVFQRTSFNGDYDWLSNKRVASARHVSMSLSTVFWCKSEHSLFRGCLSLSPGPILLCMLSCGDCSSRGQSAGYKSCSRSALCVRVLRPLLPKRPRFSEKRNKKKNVWLGVTTWPGVGKTSEASR